MSDGYTTERKSSAPRQVLSPTDGIAIILGIVIGAGIFKAPSIVAANIGSEGILLFAWLLGGVISLAGALCYAELATSYPNTGGEYHFLTRAYGKYVSFLFAWSRLTVLQTGSIALAAFVFGDYLAAVVPIGAHSTPIYAALAVVVFTALNIIGLRASTKMLNIMMAVEGIGLLALIIAGVVYAPSVATAATATTAATTTAQGFGLAMVFVMLTYGGWNESAYVSAELRDGKRNMIRVLVISIAAVTAIYLLANLAYVKVLGLEGMKASQVVAADTLRVAIGGIAPVLISLLIIIAVLTTINVSMLTGARTNHAMARDFPLFRSLGHWNGETNTPVTSMLVQGAITLLLVLIGSFSRSGFQSMVEYMSPVFWLFFLLTVFSLFILRHRDPNHERPFRVPLYPVTPLLFCAACAYMLYSSLDYTGKGALLGVAVLAAGVPLLFFLNRSPSLGRSQIPLKAEHRTGGGS